MISGAKRKSKSSAKYPKVAEYLSNQIEICGKSQKDIAFEIGYEKPNIITMFKQGLTKVPINKTGKLAKAIGVDSGYLLRMMLNEYMPDVLDAIESIAGDITTVNEQEILNSIRKLSNNSDPAMTTADSRKKLSSFVKSISK